MPNMQSPAPISAQDDLEALLRASAPPVPEPPERLAGLSAAVAAEVVSSDRRYAARSRARRRRRRIAAVTAAAFVAVPTAAWAADRWLAQTGAFGTGQGEEVDRSEWIDPCAADFPDYVRSLPQPTDITLPPRTTWATVTGDYVAQTRRGTAGDCAGDGARMQATGVRADMVFLVQGRWVCEALRREDAGDRAGVRTAGREIARTYDALDRMGVFGDSNWRPLRDHAAAGDLADLGAAAEADGSCGR